MATSKSTRPFDLLRREVSELKSLVQPSSTREKPVLTMIYGEDERLILREWLLANPDMAEPEPIVYVVTGGVPRVEYASEPSIRDALPFAKAFLEQSGADSAPWRALAEAIGVDYDAVQPERPGAVH